jgi:heptosyltransferase-2
VIPFNRKAQELFRLGVDDKFRFFENRKTLTQLFAEALELDYRGEDYCLELRPEEKDFVQSYRKEKGVDKGQKVIGINTGCSDRIPYRRFVFEKHVELIKMLLARFPKNKVALLGGREDADTNSRLESLFGEQIINTPANEGLRKGVCFVDACDFVISGDSVGLHIAIALKKQVVAWFAPTPSQEIDLYGRGLSVVSKVGCKPCWKRFCELPVKCNEIVDIDEIGGALESLISRLRS